MPKTFLDFTKTGYLSAARFIGYQGNQEFSISLQSLANAVYSLIIKEQTQPVLVYKFQPLSTIILPNSNTTYGIYLSSSVEQVDMKIDGEWLTLTKAGSCYDVSSTSVILSANKDILCPGEWFYVTNTALSSTLTFYFQNTGSAFITVEPTESEEGTPSGIGGALYNAWSWLSNIFANKELDFLEDRYRFTLETLIDSLNETLIPDVGSGLSGLSGLSDDCLRELDRLIEKRDKAIEQLESLNIAGSDRERMDRIEAIGTDILENHTLPMLEMMDGTYPAIDCYDTMSSFSQDMSGAINQETMEEIKDGIKELKDMFDNNNNEEPPVQEPKHFNPSLA